MRTRLGRAVAKATAPGRVLLTVGTVSLRSYTTPHANAADDPLPAALALVNGAKSTLTIGAYAFTLTTLRDAVIAAHQRGVVVRVVMDASQYAGANSVGPALVAAGIDLRVWGGQYALAHEKVIVADAATSSAATLWGSWNFTTQAEKVNRELCTVATGANVRRLLAPQVTAQVQASYDAGRVPPAPTPAPASS